MQLDLLAPAEPELQGLDPGARWLQFHDANPQVYDLFKRFTRHAIFAGRSSYSARAIFHRMRWHTGIETGGDEWKLNNNYSPYYARLFMIENPQHDAFFETRERQTDG